MAWIGKRCTGNMRPKAQGIADHAVNQLVVVIPCGLENNTLWQFCQVLPSTFCTYLSHQWHCFLVANVTYSLSLRSYQFLPIFFIILPVFEKARFSANYLFCSKLYHVWCIQYYRLQKMLVPLPELNQEENSINAILSYLHDHCSLINRLLSFGNTRNASSLTYHAYILHLNHSKLVHLIIAIFLRILSDKTRKSKIYSISSVFWCFVPDMRKHWLLDFQVISKDLQSHVIQQTVKLWFTEYTWSYEKD